MRNGLWLNWWRWIIFFGAIKQRKPQIMYLPHDTTIHCFHMHFAYDEELTKWPSSPTICVATTMLYNSNPRLVDARIMDSSMLTTFCLIVREIMHAWQLAPSKTIKCAMWMLANIWHGWHLSIRNCVNKGIQRLEVQR